MVGLIFIFIHVISSFYVRSMIDPEDTVTIQDLATFHEDKKRFKKTEAKSKKTIDLNPPRPT